MEISNTSCILKSRFKDVDLEEISFPQIMLNAINRQNQELDALLNAETGEKYTYGQLNSKIRCVSSGLTKLGAKKKEVICFFIQNSLEFPIMFFASAMAGLIISPANSTYTPYELKHQLANSTAVYIFTDSNLLPKVLQAKSKCIKKIIVSGNLDIKPKDCVLLKDLMNDDSSALQHGKFSFNLKEDIVLIPYSSGTTGLPKGVEITHYNISSMIQIGEAAKIIPITNNIDINNYYLIYLPMYHSYGMQTMLMALNVGKTCVILSKFQPENFLKSIEKYRPFTLHVVPPIVNFLINSPLAKKTDFSSVKTVFCGAAPLSKSSECRLKKELNVNYVFQGYGMTETTFAIVFSSIEYNKPGSCGVLLPNTELKVVDPISSKIMGVNEKGEIWSKGPQMMKGYFKNTEATNYILTNDGWLKSGDIGCYDSDGFIYVVDRIKELIKYKGLQVAPAELEAVLLSYPAVEDAAVIGVSDERAGELPMAFIVKKSDKVLTKKNINDYLKERLTDYKQLRGGIVFIEKIPKTASGKILRRELRKLSKQLKLKSSL